MNQTTTPETTPTTLKRSYEESPSLPLDAIPSNKKKKEITKRTKWTDTEIKTLVEAYGKFKEDTIKWDRIMEMGEFKNKRTKAMLQDKVKWLRAQGLWPH